VDEASARFSSRRTKAIPAGKAFLREARRLRCASLSSEGGNYTATFADDGKHFVETHSAALTPPRISLCAPGGSCQKIWEARSVADYDTDRAAASGIQGR
jgi:hypothetical protein